MIRLLPRFLPILVLLGSAQPAATQSKAPASQAGPDFDLLMEGYWEDYLRLHPIEATFIGDNRFNDLLPVDFTRAHETKLKDFYSKYLGQLAEIDTTGFSPQERLNFDLLQYTMEIGREGLSFHDYTPVDQLGNLAILFPVLGSGRSVQPFESIDDYRDFLQRMDGFVVWVDSAIVYMQQGMAAGYILPTVLTERTLPQLESQVVTDPVQSTFYGPVTNMPPGFSEADSSMFANAYVTAIQNNIVPAYRKLLRFMRDEYLPHTRATSGIWDLPDGQERYAYLVRYYTSTSLTPDEVFEIGMREVQRIRTEMESVKDEAGFEGDLESFFEHVRTSPDMFPFDTEEDVLDAYRAIEAKIAPNIDGLFSEVPKTGFEIRQVEEFREASTSEHYFPPSQDGSRPGVFYVPIVDPTRYSAMNMENTFLHEAIPGHHFQIAFQMEQTDLPSFRRFSGYGAYTEGWGLYAEGLGEDLGLYTDPYQYFGRLMWDMHRALRLAVDAGIHAKRWTREQAIQFMLENNAVDEPTVTREVERYMAIPGQALSYKIGELKILELRKRARHKLGQRFDIRAFHEAVLKNGSMPLSILERQIDSWIEDQLSSAPGAR